MGLWHVASSGNLPIVLSDLTSAKDSKKCRVSGWFSTPARPVTPSWYSRLRAQ